MLEDIISTYQEAFSNPLNIFLLALMFAMLLFWFSAHYWQTPERVKKRAIFFSPKHTQYMQERFRSHKMDVFTTQVWLWAFVVLLILEIYMCGLQGWDAWRYGFAFLPAWTITMAIQFAFPVIVPNRWKDFGQENPVVPIRLDIFPQSDNVNGLLYNGLPSNHFGIMIGGAVLCLLFGIANNDAGWFLGIPFFLFWALLFAWSVIYLGEHYIYDLIASIFVYPPVIIIIWYLTTVFVPLT